MKKEALLIIDMLNDFVRKDAPLEVPETRIIIPRIKYILYEARRKKIPVIYVCDAHSRADHEIRELSWPLHAVKGTEGAAIIRELKPGRNDIIIEKKTYSGFYRTKLESTLKKLGVNSLLLTGCVTHICILFTASDAVLRGYDVSVFEDAVAGLSRKDHDAALRIIKNVLGVKLL